MRLLNGTMLQSKVAVRMMQQGNDLLYHMLT